MAHGGVEVRNFDWAFGGSHAVFVRGTDDGTSLDAAAGHHGAKAASPVIASAAVVDTGGASEFAEDYHERFAEHAVRLEVGKERCDGGVHRGAVVAHGVEDVAVIVETAAVDLHEADSFFDEASGQ